MMCMQQFTRLSPGNCLRKLLLHNNA
jgi:hypothetical protein